ncbi:isocitrate dehydrogenase (NAD(+)) [Gottschalkiaceae bacterium SANA]|nr:isocitrate dehydrogenase (NAD(+)) [Gottschalkiaceae bacterium SANA]
MNRVTFIPGDGIGPEVAKAAKEIIDASGVAIEWETVNAGEAVFQETGVLVPDEVYKSIEKNRVALKGPITTPVGSGFRSINVHLRNRYDLYANIRPIISLQGERARYPDLDLVIFRENTEGLYIGDEEFLDADTVIARKRITRKGSTRIMESAFAYAAANGRKKVTVAHKANILKDTDGLFLTCARAIAEKYPNIEYEEVIIDNMCMQLVINPYQFDVVATMNLYGDILSDLCAGLVGGLGLVPGANIGEDIAIFEAVHGSAPKMAGKNTADPVALILSGASLLDYLGETEAAKKVRDAVAAIVKEGVHVTKDLGGTASTTEMTAAIINKMQGR